MTINKILKFGLIVVAFGLLSVSCGKNKSNNSGRDSERIRVVEETYGYQDEYGDDEYEDEYEESEPIQKYVQCPICYGSGYCGAGCGGSGRIYSYSAQGLVDCEVCGGSGRCQMCDGTGRVEDYSW